MSSPEIDRGSENERNVDQVVEHPQDIVVPEQLEQAGVTAVPSQPANLTDDHQVVVKSVPAAPGPDAIKIPVDPEQAQAWVDTKDDEDPRTWNGVFIIRLVKKAILHGRKLLIGG